MDYIFTTLGNLVHQTAFFNLTVGNFIMIFVACFFLYLAIGRGYEPLLLVPIAFGMLLVNLYPDIMKTVEEAAADGSTSAGLLHYFFLGDEWGIWPSLIFLGVGAMTDCQSCQLSSGSSSTVWYFLCLYWRYVSWI